MKGTKKNVMKYTPKIESTLEKARQEIRDLQSDLKAGTLDRNQLKSGLQEVQQQLKVMSIHNHKATFGDGDDDDK